VNDFPVKKHLETHIATPFLDAHRFGWVTLGPPLAPVTQPHPNGKPKIHRNRRAYDPFQLKDWNPTQILRVFFVFFRFGKGSISRFM